MTLLQLIVNAVLTILLPIMIGAVYWYSRALAQRLPEQQRVALLQFSKLAVHYVLQEHSASTEKQKLAIAYTANLFNYFELPVPAEEAIAIAVGAAFFEVSRIAKAAE